MASNGVEQPLNPRFITTDQPHSRADAAAGRQARERRRVRTGLDAIQDALESIDLLLDGPMPGVTLRRAARSAGCRRWCFVTACHTYALTALEMDARDYVVRPFDE